MDKKGLLYEGKAKKIYMTEDNSLLIAEFKDDLTAENAAKKGSEEGKGALNCKISAKLFSLLEDHGIKTHFVKILDDNKQLIKKVDMLMIEVVVRNIATGSLTKRLGIQDGTELPFALVEFYYKDDTLNDPILNDEHCIMMDLVKSESDLEELKRLGREINSVLKKFFSDRKLNLVDFKVEFGVDSEGYILLSDEISPDNCRLWDIDTNERLDKDVFRQDLGNVKEAYQEVLNRILK